MDPKTLNLSGQLALGFEWEPLKLIFEQQSLYICGIDIGIEIDVTWIFHIQKQCCA